MSMTTKRYDEIYHLVWLDHLPTQSDKKHATQLQFRSIINDVKNFQDQNQCEDYLRSVSSLDRLILIVNGQIGQKFLPRIYHQTQSIISIYVICADRTKHLSWTSQYPKIRAVVTNYDDLYSAVSYDQSRRFRCKIDDPLLISIFDDKHPTSYDSSIIDDQLVYSQMFFDYLFPLQSSSSSVSSPNQHDRLFAYLRDEYESNEKMLERIDEFEKNYSTDRSIWWYTQDSWIYHLLNRAFRRRDIFILVLFQFLIIDIQDLLKKYRVRTKLCVYRSEWMLRKDREYLENAQDRLICVNSLVWCNVNRKSALSYLKEFSSSMNEEYEKILFEIDCPPSHAAAADDDDDGKGGCAMISSLKYYEGEQEVMFMLGSIFRLMEMKKGENDVWIIRMRLIINPCEEKEFDQVEYIQSYRQINRGERKEMMNRLSFGYLLMEMKRFDQAKNYFDYLLSDYRNENDQEKVIECCDALGEIYLVKEEYDLSIDYYNRSLEMKKNLYDENENGFEWKWKWRKNYNQLGLIYMKQSMYVKAMEYYEMLLEILESGSDHDDEMCMCLNNIASIHRVNGKYEEAIRLYEKILSMNEKRLMWNDPEIGLCLMHLGMMYSCLHVYDLSLEYFHRSLNVYESVVCPPHALLGMIYENVGNIYNDKNEVDEALLWYEKAHIMYEKLFPSTYCDWIQVRMVMKKLSSRL